jgi:hypothetical protein
VLSLRENGRIKSYQQRPPKFAEPNTINDANNLVFGQALTAEIFIPVAVSVVRVGSLGKTIFLSGINT